MTQRMQIDSVGWLFFGMMLALLLGPCIYLVLKLTNDTLTIGMRVGSGITLGVMGAAFVSWLVNSLLQWRAHGHDATGKEPDIESDIEHEPAASGTPTKKKKKKKKK